MWLFYTANTAGAAALTADTHNFTANKQLWVKLAEATAEDYVFDTKKVTAVPNQAGWYTLTLTGDVTGAADSTLVIAKVQLTVESATTKVGVYSDAACQTEIASNTKYIPGTTLYVKAKDQNTLKETITSDAISDYTLNATSGIASFKIQKAVADPDTLFATTN